MNVFHNFKTTENVGISRGKFMRAASDKINQMTHTQMVIQEGFAKDKGPKLKPMLCLHDHR